MTIEQASPTDIRLSLPVIQSLLVITGFAVTWIVGIWKQTRVNAKKEADLYSAIDNVKHDINAVGERVNTTNTSCSKHEEAIQGLRIEQQRATDDRNHMRERIAGNDASIAALQEELKQERLEVMSTMHANERAAAERDARTREELARISERLDIERMVTSVVRNLSTIQKVS